MSARSDAALSFTGGTLGGLAIGSWIARRYPKTAPAKAYSPVDAKVTSITKIKGAKP